MLTNELQKQFKAYSNYIESTLILKYSVGEDDNSKKMEEFLKTISSLTEKITIEKVDLPLTPSFTIVKGNKEVGVTYAGIPLGHEFESFVLSLIQASGRKPKLKDEDIERIKAIEEKIDFKTIVSLSCHNCPDVVQTLNAMAILNDNITHTMIDGAFYEDLVKENNVMAVPFVFKNGENFHGGRIKFNELLDKVIGSKKLVNAKEKGVFDTLVIGGGPSSGAAAIYAKRKGIKTGIVCSEFGGQVNETLGIENIIGTKYTEGPKFMQSVKEHVEQYGVDIMEGFMATDFEKLEDGNFSVTLDSDEKLLTKTLIISTGARWRLLNIPGEKEFKNKGVAYCPHCDGPLFKDKKVAVIGGGNSGVEAAIDLANLAKNVVVIEFADTLKADQVLQDKLKSLENVEVITSAMTTSIDGKDSVESLTYVDRKTDQKHTIDLQGVFILVGLVPNTEWIGEKLEKTKIGEIITKKDQSTNIEGVFASGDCSDQTYKQIVISIGSGATAALSAFNYLMRK